MDWTGCDVVECVPGRLGGQPVVKNSRVTAPAVVESYDLGETVEEIAYSFDLDPDDIRKIIGFADEHNPVQHPVKGTFQSERKTANFETSGPQGVVYFGRFHMDWTGCSIVEIVPGKVSGKPILKHSRVTADAVLESYELGETVEEIVESFDLNPDDVRCVLDFAASREPLRRTA